MSEYVKYIVCPICEDFYYTNTDGDHTHVEVCELVCKKCAPLMSEPEPPDMPEPTMYVHRDPLH